MVRESKKVKRVWQSVSEGLGEQTLKVTELSVPHIAGIPLARPIGLSDFIKQLPSKTYKQAWSCRGNFKVQQRNNRRTNENKCQSSGGGNKATVLSCRNC